MTQPFLQRPIAWGIRVWQLLAFIALYSVFAFQYWFTLWLTSNFYENNWRGAFIDYFVVKALLTAPLWYLYFVVWKNKSLTFKLLMHLVTGPAWILAWFKIYRLIQDAIGGGYLRGNGIWWDIYIPGLVYCLQFAVFHVYDFYLQNKKQKEKEKSLMQAAFNSEVSALKAQIQPHFLFNTLNSISASVPQEMEHTRELIAKLADTFRYSLKASENEWISLREELDFTRVTLDLEKERLRERLQVIYDIDESLLDTRVPPMLLQPITENAIKHGIAPKIEGGTIRVSVQRPAVPVGSSQGILISVSDSGIGYDGSLDESIFLKGIGLRNSNQRLEKLYNQKIHVERNPDCGLRFSFTIF